MASKFIKFTDWYIMVVNQWRGLSFIRGPYTTTRIQAFLKAGEITEDTLIRYGTNSPWQPLKDEPIFAAAVREVGAKRNRSAFWKKYRTGILLIALIAGAAIYAREQPPRYLSKSNNPVGYALSREVLTGEAIVALTNKARAVDGLTPLRENQLLNAIAESRAKDMLEKQYFAHVSPAGRQASDIAQSVGYQYKIISENIGMANFLTNQKMIDGWMQSPGHRSNILSREVEEIGAAVLKGRMKGLQTYVAVQIFGLQSPPVPQHICVAPPRSLFDDIELGKAEIAGLIDQMRRLKEELEAEKEAIETDRRFTYGDPQKINSLNVKIGAHNEKSHWHNRVGVDVKAKSVVLEAMVDEYNRMLQAYNDCRASR